MEQYETRHYIFNYNKNSKAGKDVIEIAKYQESCLKYICSVLRIYPDFKIEYYLCDTPEEVGHIYGDDEPCNGFTDLPNKIYAVYNDEVQCIGFHEDAHVISYLINRPNSCAIREGLAMYFDRKWWGIQNLDWTGYFIKTNKFIQINQLLNDDIFFNHDCSITYPIMGAFTDWLISTYGIERYLEFYKQEDIINALKEIYNKTPLDMNQSFVDYVNLFKIDEKIEQRMEALLNE
ncbi:MAG: hypothetical protein SPJ09_05020 [Erysipelotrichaceae bacterium]|nr:hypothetical protein [Erysipelotrichaceae bacterium]